MLDSILAVGERAGARPRRSDCVAACAPGSSRSRARTAGRSRPRVAIIEWTDPPFTAGHWIPDLVTAAGGEPVAAQAGRPVGAR